MKQSIPEMACRNGYSVRRRGLGSIIGGEILPNARGTCTRSNCMTFKITGSDSKAYELKSRKVKR